MLIVNSELSYSYHPIMHYIPKRLRKLFLTIKLDSVEEIRLRKGKPIMIYGKFIPQYVGKKEISPVLKDDMPIVTEEDINEALELISASSLYAVEDRLKNGYITVTGGHRIGFCGSAVLKNGRVCTIKNISGLNYRISREINGAGDVVINSIMRGKKILNTLIISPPGCGKTTLLRDVIRQISQKGIRVSVADERNEISALHNGFCGFDLGASCDILEGASKEEAMTILIRSMGPEVIATDEIGTAADVSVIKKAIQSGVCVISTIHSDHREALMKKHADIAECFECMITLSHRNGPGTIEEIYCGI